MKLIRLQSGPLACVYQDEDVNETPQRTVSGFYRAFSGSVEAAGASEREALEALDRNLRHLSEPPSEPESSDDSSPETVRSIAGNDTVRCEPPVPSMPSLARCGEGDTVRAPCPSSLPAIAFAVGR